MGIINRNNALYMATGIDNSGLYEGKREAMGILKAMAGEVTSFDIFGGIGISAATAFAKAAMSSYEFEKELKSNMAEVSTISDEVSGNVDGYINQIIALTKEIPISAPDAAKALYQIVSAGHDGAEGMKILEISAKSAIAGVTDTTTAADAITTILNAYKMSADKAASVSDQLFNTAKLGKTTFGELGQSIAQAAPIAASYGVEIDQLLAAVASLTKQGTPTAEAMTQIRAAILGVSKVLGDGAFDGRTFQDALKEVAAKANGSESKLRELVPEIEAVNGVLGMTGRNAKAAASDLEVLQKSTGATDTAFKKMNEEADNQMKLLGNNILAYLRPMGESILKEVSEVATKLNEAFANQDLGNSLKELNQLVLTIAGTFALYKGVVVATSLVQAAYAAVIKILNSQKVIEAANLVLTKGMYAAEASMVAKNMAAHILLTRALKSQIAPMLASGKAALANPYVLTSAAIAALGYGIYKLVIEEKEGEKAQKEYNAKVKSLHDWAEKTKSKTDELISTLHDENAENLKKVEAYNQLQKLYPSELKNLTLQQFLLMNAVDANNMLTKAINERKIATEKANVESIKDEISKADKSISEYKEKVFNNDGSKYNIADALYAAKHLRDLEDRRQQLKNNYDNAVKDVVQSYKDRIAAEALGEQQEEQAKKNKASSGIAGNKKNDFKKEAELRKELNQLILDNDIKLQSERIALEKDGKDKEVAVAKQESSEKIAEIEKERQAYLDKAKEAKTVPDSNVIADYNARIEIEHQSLANSLSSIDEKYNNDYAERSKSLAEVFQNDEQSKLSAIRERYDKERKWAREQYSSGGISKKQFTDYSVNINSAQTEETSRTILANINDFKQKEKDLRDKWDTDINAAVEQKDAYLIAKLMEGKQKALSDLNGQMLQESDEWQQLFGDLDTLTYDQIDNLITTIQTKAKDLNLPPVEMEQVYKSLGEAKEKLVAINPFKTLGKAAKAVFEDTSKDSQKSSQETKADWKNLASATKGCFDFVNDAVEQCSLLKDVIGESGQQAISMIESVTMAGIAMATAIKTAEKASAILAIISAALQAVTMVYNLFGKANEVSQKTINQYNALMDTIDDVIDKHKQLMDELSGTNAVSEYNTSQELIEKQIKATRNLGLEYLSSNAAHSHTYGYKLRKDLEDYRSQFSSIGISWNQIVGTGRMEGLFSLSANQLSTIKEKLPEAWAKLDDKTRDYLETIIECDDKAKEMTEDLASSLNQISFDDLYSEFQDTILNMDADSATMAGNLEKYLQKAILKSMLDSSYKSKLKTWYDAFTKANEDGKVTSDEAAQLRQQWKDISDAAIAERDSLKTAMGWTSDTADTSDNSLKGAYAKASQESIDLLAGQTGASRVVLEKINEGMTPIREQMRSIYDIHQQGLEEVKAIHQLMINVDRNTDSVRQLTQKVSEYAQRSSERLEGTLNVKVKM